MKTLQSIAWTLAGISVAIFFLVAAHALFTMEQMAKERLPHYEALWSRGWNDFNSISHSIEQLTQTTKPFVDEFPKLVRQVGSMNLSVQRMETSVTYLSSTVPPQMGIMTGQIGRMRRDMTPQGMMRNMMPW